LVHTPRKPPQNDLFPRMFVFVYPSRKPPQLVSSKRHHGTGKTPVVPSQLPVPPNAQWDPYKPAAKEKVHPNKQARHRRIVAQRRERRCLVVSSQKFRFDFGLLFVLLAKIFAQEKIDEEDC